MRREPRLLADQHDVRVRELPARARDVPPRLTQQLERVGSLEGRIAGGEERADVLEPGGSEHRVRERVREHVAVGVAREAARMVDPNAAEHERHAVLQRMRIEAGPDAVLAHVASHDAIFARSSAVVTLSRRGSPSTTFTRPPAASTSPAQSVASASPAAARRKTSATKACGVWTA